MVDEVDEVETLRLVWYKLELSVLPSVLWVEDTLTFVLPPGLLIVCWVEPLAGTLTGWPLTVTLVDAAPLLPVVLSVLVVVVASFAAAVLGGDTGTVAEVGLTGTSIDAGRD